VAAIEDLGPTALICEGDVRDQAQLEAAVAAGVEHFGGIDIVIANAGIGPAARPSWEIAKEDWDRVIAINLTGVWQTVAAAAPAMIEGGPAERSSSPPRPRGCGDSATSPPTSPPSTAPKGW
jgi:NAD(P)-dependent dehydrogenase (short-subunit alcohol dehydrogenase family)